RVADVYRTVDAIEEKGLTDFAGCEGDAPRDGSVVAADSVVGVALGAPPADRAGQRDRIGPGGIGADVVALDRVAVGIDLNIVAGIAADDVSRAAYRATDGVAAGAAGHGHAVVAVGQSDGAGGISADVVALDDVVAAAGARNRNAIVCVAADDVAV